MKCGSRSEGKTEKDFNKADLDYGTSVEMEHTCDPVLARRICMDHLSESPLYYKELKKMEQKLEKMKRRRK